MYLHGPALQGRKRVLSLLVLVRRGWNPTVTRRFLDAKKQKCLTLPSVVTQKVDIYFSFECVSACGGSIQCVTKHHRAKNGGSVRI